MKTMDKKKLQTTRIKAVAPLVLCLVAAGCGSNRSSRGYDSEPLSESYGAVYENSASVSLTKGGGVQASESYMDYSDTYISGTMTDYSYNFSANGELKNKTDALNEYEKIQQFVDEHDGYVENVRNNYNGYDIDWTKDYFSSNEMRYKATGNVNFTVQVDNSQIPEIVKELESYTDQDKLTVTRYDQYITNYEAYEIVDENDDRYYGSQKITQQELDKRLKYASLNISIAYRIPRSGFTRFLLTLLNVVNEVKEAFLRVIAVILMLAVAGYIALFVAVLPMYKIIKKSLFKYRLKHREYYLPKEVVVNSAAMEAVLDEHAEAFKNKKAKEKSET